MVYLSQARRRAGLTQAQLAGRSGVARTTIGKLEAGVALPQPATVKALAKALGMEPARLRFDQTQQTEPNGRPSNSAHVEYLADGGALIQLDEYMDVEVQTALFGKEKPWLTQPDFRGKGIRVRPPSGNQIELQLREVPALLDRVLRDAADLDAPWINTVTADTICLTTWAVDETYEYSSEVAVPRSLVVAVRWGAAAKHDLAAGHIAMKHPIVVETYDGPREDMASDGEAP